MPRSPDPDRLGPYRARRRGDASRTVPTSAPQPSPRPSRGRAKNTYGDQFVVQEHHARALHWDFLLERDAVLASWAVPKGLPLERGPRRLAVRTEDHPVEYASFVGTIPRREYGAGRVSIWDTGTYECEKWSDDEVMVVLHGNRIDGRYVLIRTGGNQWLAQRMNDTRADREPMPKLIRPMLATSGSLPARDDGWAFEFKWDGVRTVVYVEGGRARLMSRNDRDVTVSYPELSHAFEVLGSRDAVLDGEVVAFDDRGRPNFGLLQQRMHVLDPGRSRQLAERVPAAMLLFDVLFLDGRSTVDLPYRERRELLESLGLSGPNLGTPPWFGGAGRDVLQAAREQGLEGVVAKRVASTYQPGRRSPDWIKVKHVRAQEVVVGGWTTGQGRRRNTLGALLLGIPEPQGLAYVGNVGTGFTDAVLDELGRMLAPLEQRTSPFMTPVPSRQAVGAHWVEPRLVGEVTFSEWTTDHRLRHPVWRGLRPDKSVSEVTRES